MHIHVHTNTYTHTSIYEIKNILYINFADVIWLGNGATTGYIQLLLI